jgi:hypothetical protein
MVELSAALRQPNIIISYKLPKLLLTYLNLEVSLATVRIYPLTYCLQRFCQPKFIKCYATILLLN